MTIFGLGEKEIQSCIKDKGKRSNLFWDGDTFSCIKFIKEMLPQSEVKQDIEYQLYDHLMTVYSGLLSRIGLQIQHVER